MIQVEGGRETGDQAGRTTRWSTQPLRELMLDYSMLSKYLGRTYLVSGNRGSKQAGGSVQNGRCAGHH